MKSNQSIQINEDNTVTVILSNGDRLTLREPLGKDMDGLSQDLIKIKHTDQVQKLIGRISSPQLTRQQYGKLGIADTQVLNTALDFFQRRRQRGRSSRRRWPNWATCRPPHPSRRLRSHRSQRPAPLRHRAARGAAVFQCRRRLPRPMRGHLRRRHCRLRRNAIAHPPTLDPSRRAAHPPGGRRRIKTPAEASVRN